MATAAEHYLQAEELLTLAKTGRGSGEVLMTGEHGVKARVKTSVLREEAQVHALLAVAAANRRVRRIRGK